MKIKIEHLSKKFTDVDVIQDLSFEVPDGELWALIGPSGCGKSTLIRMIAGLIPVTSGKIYFGDKDVTALSAQSRNTAMVFQSYALFPNLNVFENVAFGLKVKQMPKRQLIEKVNKMLERVELLELANKKIQELSGGQRQRVALARALVIEPDILLFDEPLSNLDQGLRVSMRQIIRNLQQEFGITTIYITHDQEEAMSIADKIVLMDKGRIQQIGKPQTLYFDPKNYLVANFIGEGNFIKTQVTVRDGLYEINLLGETLTFNTDEQFKGKTIIMIRPENLSLTTDKGQAGYIKFREFLGLFTRYHVQTEDQLDLMIDVINKSNELPHEVGEQVKVIFDPNAIRFLADSE